MEDSCILDECSYLHHVIHIFQTLLQTDNEISNYSNSMSTDDFFSAHKN